MCALSVCLSVADSVDINGGEGFLSGSRPESYHTLLVVICGAPAKIYGSWKKIGFSLAVVVGEGVDTAVGQVSTLVAAAVAALENEGNRKTALPAERKKGRTCGW